MLFRSEKTAEVIDSETSEIIAEQMARAKKILKENAEGHNKLAQMLIEKEVITSDDVEAILGPWPRSFRRGRPSKSAIVHTSHP